MAKRIQITKIEVGGKTYTISRELDEHSPSGYTHRSYKAWNEYLPGYGCKKHKVLIDKSTNFFQALMDITSDIGRKQMVMVPAEYLKELQALRQQKGVQT